LIEKAGNAQTSRSGVLGFLLISRFAFKKESL
jgi:hypothetical protein